MDNPPRIVASLKREASLGSYQKLKNLFEKIILTKMKSMKLSENVFVITTKIKEMHMQIV